MTIKGTNWPRGEGKNCGDYVYMTSSGKVNCLGGFIFSLTPATPSPNIAIDILVD
jgi:hypothetical protein